MVRRKKKSAVLPLSKREPLRKGFSRWRGKSISFYSALLLVRRNVKGGFLDYLYRETRKTYGGEALVRRGFSLRMVHHSEGAEKTPTKKKSRGLLEGYRARSGRGTSKTENWFPR